MSFLCIPEALLVSILMDWLSLKDFGRLDSAMCNRTSRAELHRLVKSSQHCFCETWSYQHLPSSEWMIKRGARCNVIHMRENQFHDNLQLLSLEFFLRHTGKVIHTFQITLPMHLPSEYRSKAQWWFKGILLVLSMHCTCLKKLCISVDKREDIDGSYLTKESLLSLHTLLNSHRSLQDLCLQNIKYVPVSLLELALSSLQKVSLQECSIAEDVPITALTTTARLVTFETTNTPLPLLLCAFVTDLSTNSPLDQHGNEVISHYTNLTKGTVNIWEADYYPPLTIAPLICTYWDKLTFLQFSAEIHLSEDTVLGLVKALPLLQVFDATSFDGVCSLNSKYTLFPSTSRSGSQLQVLCMHCYQTETLQEVLQLCPQLTTLFLVHASQHPPVTTNYIPVETSLHLICNTNIRHLYLSQYDSLCNTDILALQHAQLHTLSIKEAGEKLTDIGILHLIPTLRLLHTLELSYCYKLSHKIVLKLPPLSATLRSFTFYTNVGYCCDSKFTSPLILEEALPMIFPHVKTFTIRC